MDFSLLLVKVSVILLVGFIGSILARKLKLPNVSGYLVLGLILGPSLGLIFKGYGGFITSEDQEIFSFISQIALAFIAFSIGSEFSVRNIKKMGKEIFVLTTLEVVGTVVMVFLFVFFSPKPNVVINGYNIFSNNNLAFSLILASMAAATAPAATLMVIRQYRAYGPVTKAILPITALDDIFGIIVFGFAISFAKMLLPGALPTSMALIIFKPLIEVFGSLIIGILIGYLLSLLAKKYDKIRDDIQVISLIAIIFSVGGTFLFNKEFSHLGITLSPLLINIMVGTMVANLVRFPERTFQSINDLATPFYIMFFTLAGASLDFAILKQDGLILVVAVAFIVSRALGKTLGIKIGAKISNSDPNIGKYLGLALLPQGGISIGLLTIVAMDASVLHQSIAAVIMLSILFYETLGPVFAKYAISQAGEMYGLDSLEESMFEEDVVEKGEI